MAKHDRKRNRHKKHKKKHRRTDLDQNGADGSDGINDDEGKHRDKKRHGKKNRGGEHGHNERKKRKHKHRPICIGSSASHLVDGDKGRVTEDRSVAMEKTAKHKKLKQDVLEAPPPSATFVGNVTISQGQSLQE